MTLKMAAYTASIIVIFAQPMEFVSRPNWVFPTLFYLFLVLSASSHVAYHFPKVWAAWAGGVTTQIARPQGGALILGTSAAFYTHGTIARDAIYDNEVFISSCRFILFYFACVFKFK
jgi:hypothetical protein